MADPYIGEIRMFAGNFAPAGWMFCEGQLLAISENEALFALIGTTYGGDGESTFGLPDLRGRVPIHQGGGLVLSETGGTEEVTLTVNQIPGHLHGFSANPGSGTSANVQGNLLSTSSAVQVYRESTANQNMNAAAIGSAGGSRPHANLQPYLCVDFIISLFGIFPSQS